MDEKSRIVRFAIGLVATLVATIVIAAIFGSLAVPLVLAVGLGLTLLAGGGLGGRKG